MKIVWALLSLAAAAGSAFFLYYTVRLVTVWHVRLGPRPVGMYIGALAFPMLCVGLGWAARRFAQRVTRVR